MVYHPSKGCTRGFDSPDDAADRSVIAIITYPLRMKVWSDPARLEQNIKGIDSGIKFLETVKNYADNPLIQFDEKTRRHTNLTWEAMVGLEWLREEQAFESVFSEHLQSCLKNLKEFKTKLWRAHSSNHEPVITDEELSKVTSLFEKINDNLTEAYLSKQQGFFG